MGNRAVWVVLIHLHPDKRAAFEEFERHAMPILRRHGGSLDQRLRSTDRGGPDEIHLVSFPDEAAFAAYRADPEYVALADARAAAIRETTVLGGAPAPAFDTNPVDDALRIVGLDHVYLSVTDMSRSERFYDAVMQALGFRKGDKPIAGERHAHYFNPAMQITIRPSRLPDRADPYRAGLHHLCLQAASEAAVYEAHARLTKLRVTCTTPKKYPEYNPDYYATFFEDPDGIRFEVVARTPHRERVARRWNDFTVFLNPVGELLAREPSGS